MADRLRAAVRSVNLFGGNSMGSQGKQAGAGECTSGASREKKSQEKTEINVEGGKGLGY